MNDESIGRSFKVDLDNAIARAGAKPLDWSKGTWQKVRLFQEVRKTYVHTFTKLQEYFPDPSTAENGVSVTRSGIIEIYAIAGKAPPPWVYFDFAPGWATASSMPSIRSTYTALGASIEIEDTTRVCVVTDGIESLVSILPITLEIDQLATDLVSRTKMPIQGVRIYTKGKLVLDKLVVMRGN